MKPKPSLRSFLALAGSALLLASQAHAATYYWDSDSTTAGLGDTAGTWGSSTFWGNITNPVSRQVLRGTLATANTTIAAGDTVYFGTVNLALGSTASTIGIVGTNVQANRIVFGVGQGAQGVTLSGGGGAITLTNANANIVANNTGTNTIGAVLAGTTGLLYGGSGTVLLTGGNTFTGGVTVTGGGTLQVGNGTSGSLTSQNLTFHSGAGVFNVRAADAGSTQAMGTLTLTNTGATAGEGTVQSTYGSSGNAELSFTSLAARQGGATGNFVVSGGTNGSTNKIVLTGAAAGFLNTGLYFGGSSFAAYDGSGYVRGLIYGTDTDAAATNTITASNHVQLSSSPVARPGDTLLSLNLAGGAVDYTMDSGTLTVPAILKTGIGAASTISGGDSLTTAGNAELVVRTDSSSDSLTISTGITGTSGGLTKTGKGTLTLSGTNGYTGVTRILDGTLVLDGGSAIVDGQQILLANAPGAILQLNANETVANVYGGGLSGGNVNVQGNTLTYSSNSSIAFGGTYTGTSGGGVIKQGTGTLTLSNKNTFAGSITLEGGTVSFTYGNDGTGTLIPLSSGGAINMAHNTTLNFNPTQNLPVGVIGSQLQSDNGGSPAYPYGWTVANDINIASGTSTANITVVGNENSVRFTGNVTGGASDNQTLSITTGNAQDREIVAFSGVIADGSGGTLGLSATLRAANNGTYVNLTNNNTFSGPISVTTTNNAPGYLVIGGERHSSTATLVTGAGSLGSGGVYSNTISLTNTGSGVSILSYASSANQTLSGEISGTGGRLLKDGVGTLTLSSSSGNSYTGVTTVNAGTLLVNNTTGSGTGTGNVSVTAGTLGGTGSISGTVTIGNSSGSADAILAPGTSIESLATGDLTFNSDGSYAVEVDGTSVTCDVTNVTGAVSINAATILSVNVTGTLSASQEYVIVSNDGDETDPVTGTFADLAQDEVVDTFGSFDLKISYTGGDGNDIVLYTVATGGITFADWRTANGAGSQTLADDHDNDGVDNGTEFFLGGDTDTTGFTPLPSVVNNAGTLSATWAKHPNYPGAYGTDFVVQTSETLADPWTNEASPGTVTISGNNVTYTFRNPLGTKKFARLKVTGPN